MRAFRKHAGWLTALAAGLALLIMSGVLVQMAGRPSLKLDPVQGDPELLKEISLTGVMGDESCSVEFSLENGELQQQFSSRDWIWRRCTGLPAVWPLRHPEKEIIGTSHVWRSRRKPERKSPMKSG